MDGYTLPLVAFTASAFPILVVYWFWKRWKHAEIARLKLERDSFGGE